jgi:hypothetical protein
VLQSLNRRTERLKVNGLVPSCHERDQSLICAENIHRFGVRKRGQHQELHQRIVSATGDVAAISEMAERLVANVAPFSLLFRFHVCLGK